MEINNIFKIFITILLLVFNIVTTNAAFKLTHKVGAYENLMPNGMQQVHTETQILYAKPGEWVYLYRPERSSFISYVRWYNYDTDRAIPKSYNQDDSPTGAIVSRIESTWAKDTLATNPKFKSYNDYGWFAYNYASDRVTTSDVSYIEIKYRMHTGDSIYRIACDESIWTDNFVWNANGAVIEPTLSKRVIYEIRPAAWMADSLELCKVSPETENDKYLEEYDMIAPTGRQLYIGPAYMYHTKDVSLKQYAYHARSNYYYINSQGNVTSASTNNRWKWYKNGVEDPTIILDNTSSQFAPISGLTPETVIYELKYNSATGYYFNVARFKVTYMDVNEVGPAVSLPATTKKMDKIYEQTFNFDRPNTTNFAFWLGHLDVDESSYGYYNKNLDGSPSYRKIRQGNITWSEYAVTNKKQVWVDSGTAPQVYQHIDSTENIANNAKEGYMLYVDGSQQPGLVFDLKVSAELCPGATMYFTAWLCDASSEKNGSNGRSAPNMDFVVTGVDENGIEYALTTFTTGEFGINAPENLNNGTWSTSNRMQRAKWHQIIFPVKFTAETTYPSYRLQIRNKSTSSDGNDFAIDDIRIYVQKPPVVPIQASTYNCPTSSVDSITAYLRVDYQAIDINTNTFYYQWRDDKDSVVKADYLNGNEFGIVSIPSSESEIINSGDTCVSLISFDSQYYNTQVPIVKYIKERLNTTEERYIMYIAQPLIVKTNYIYTGFVTTRPSDLGDKSGCGTFAELMISGGTRILINGEALGDSVVSICGNRSYTLDIVLTYITQNISTGILEEHTTPCRADWLIGDSSYVNSNREVYHYSFSQIEEAILDYRTSNPRDLSKTIVNHLLKQNLLTLDTATTNIQPSISLSYTAFPVPASAENNMAVCLTPRFLKISPNEVTNNIIVIEEGSNLPGAISDRPRIFRLSETKKNIGDTISLRTNIKGEGVVYEVDTVLLVSSTNPSWEPIGLRVYSEHNPLQEGDSIFIFGNNLQGLEAGYDYTFHVVFKEEDEGCSRGYTYFTLRIVPDQVTWLGGDWNVDASWSSYVPLPETNVILQQKDYEVTFSEDTIYDLNFTSNQCNHIYLPNDASLAGQEKITVNGIAFIDIKEYAWKWTLTSFPIYGVVSGDIFVKQNESTDPFVIKPIDQVPGEYAADRQEFIVYTSEYDKDNNKWKSAKKSTAREISPGQADMIGIDCESNAVNPIIRLPKVDNMYRHYDTNTQLWMSYNEEYINRNENYGKLIFTGDTIFTLKEMYDEVYLFGNPTLGYIDITKLVQDNSDKLTGRYQLNIEGVSKRPNFVEFSNEFDATTSEYHILLPPAKGILLEGKIASNVLDINVTTNNVNPKGRVPLRRQVANNDNIPTDLNNTANFKNTYIVYDLMGRLIGNNIKIEYLPKGFYILIYENETKKIYKN